MGSGNDTTRNTKIFLQYLTLYDKRNCFIAHTTTAPSTGHHEVFLKLTVRAKTLRQSELRKGRTLRASDLEIVYSDRFTLTTQLIKPDYVMISPHAVPQFL